MEMEVEKVSVIIPNYNYSTFIERCITSVVNQTYKNIEIIVVDDCSTDDSIDILQKLQLKYSFKILQNIENSGVSISRNKGIENATGSFICFLDPDDCWYSQKIEKQLNAIQEQKTNLCFTDIDILEDNTICHTRKHFYTSFTYNELLKRNFIAHSTLMLQKDLLQNVRYRNINTELGIIKFLMKTTKTKRLIHEDYAFLLELFRIENIKATYINEPLIAYQIHNNNYSKSYIKKILSLFTIYNNYEKFNIFKSLFCTIRIIIMASIKNFRKS